MALYIDLSFRPRQFAEGLFSVDFTYDSNLDRVKQEVAQNDTTIEVRYSLGGCYDYIVGTSVNQTEEDLYLAGGYYDAPMLMQRYGDGSSYLTHLVRDYQGSIVSIVDSTGFWHNDYSYDAWGRPRNPQTHTVYNPSALNTYSSAYRGYCGHEHLPQFGLINMNARLYDPALGRFLSPDPYVQLPDFSQSFNRYSYCLNNPMKYLDENGEFFGLLGGFIRGLWETITKGDFKAPFKEGYAGLKLDLKIYGGLFKGTPKQILRRFTWESLQTGVGLLFSESKLLFHDVETVEYYHGATYILNKNSKKRNGITLGNYININDTDELPYNEKGVFTPYTDNLYMHEYGHYMQSQEYGFGYLFSVGIPSIWDLAFKGGNDKIYINDQQYKKHSLRWFEIHANIKAEPYFKELYDSWDYIRYPVRYPY